MTEEEIEKQAEEYCKKECGAYYYDCHRECSSIEALKNGAKWGVEHVIEWHNLRKNPNDLPKEYKEVLVILCGEDNYCIGTYDKKYNEWGFNEFTIPAERFDEVIAWCELPQFKDKE